MDALGGIRYGSEILAAARAHGLDPKLLAAVAAQETGGPGRNSGRNIVGDGGHGHGIFQIDDRSWAFGASPAAMRPAANADAAATILANDLARSGGNVRAALATYNAGSPAATGTKTTWGDGTTLGYADSVLRHYVALGGDPAQVQADGRETAASVNTLAGLGSQQPLASIASNPSALLSLADLGSTQSGGAGTTLGAQTLTPPVVQATSQSPFAPPVSWANEMSATGPAGGKLAADADSLVAAEIDAGADDEPTAQS